MKSEFVIELVWSTGDMYCHAAYKGEEISFCKIKNFDYRAEYFDGLCSCARCNEMIKFLDGL